MCKDCFVFLSFEDFVGLNLHSDDIITHEINKLRFQILEALLIKAKQNKTKIELIELT